MASTYVNDLRLEEMATGDQSGSWGTTTNTNLELIAEAFSFGTEAITTNADTHTTTIADGSTDPGRSLYLKYTGTLDSACTITIGPNTVSKLWFIENGTSGSQNIIISQGSGANVTIPAGDVKAVYSDGAGSGAAIVDAFASLNVVDLKVEDDLTVTDDMTVGGTLGVTGVLTATSLDISGDIDVDGTTNLDVVDIDGALTQDGGAVFNEASADVDFRVESNGQTHALFVDGGLDNIGIGYSAAHTATNKGLAILTGDGNGGVQFNKEDGSYPSDGETLGSIGWKGADSANSNAAAGASIVGIAAEDFSGSTEATNLAFNTKPTGTGPGSAPTERMRINSNGTIGIGTAGGSYAIDLLTTGNNGLRVNTGTSSADQLYLGNTGGVSSVGTLTSDDLGIITAGSERARVTTGGIVLVGKTSSGVSSVGAEIRTGSSNYSFTGTSSGHTVQLLNRTSDDGDLVEFRQDNTKFGTIASNGNDLILDVVGNIRLDADGGDIELHDAGTKIGQFALNNSGFFDIFSAVSDADIRIRGNDGGSTVTALTLDMSESGRAYFNSRVGINTTSPDTMLHINGAANSEQVIITGNGNSGRGLSIQTAASGGQQDAGVIFDAQDTEGGAAPYHAFQNAGSEKMRITSDGKIGVGTSSPQELVHLKASASAALRVSGGANDNKKVEIGYDNTNGPYLKGGSSGVTSIQFYVDNTTLAGKFDTNADFYTNDGTVHSLSDSRVKTDINDLIDGLDVVKQLQPKTFKYNEKSEFYSEETKDEVRYGFIADEVQEVAPQYMQVGKGKIDGVEVDDFKTLSTTKMIPMLVKAIQEQQTQIDALQSEINILKGE
jgi:hypothetical protein